MLYSSKFNIVSFFFIIGRDYCFFDGILGKEVCIRRVFIFKYKSYLIRWNFFVMRGF